MKINKYKFLLLIIWPLTSYVLSMPIVESQPNTSPKTSNMNNNTQLQQHKNTNNYTNQQNSVPGQKNTNVQNGVRSYPTPKINLDNSRLNDKTQTLSQGKAKTVDDPNKVILNFENADIQTVIKAISVLSGKNFVIDPRVKGTVNIVSDKPVSKADSYKVLESALRMQGFASVEADGVIKVLPEADARTYGMKMDGGLGGQVSPKHQLGDQVITKIFVIQHGSATALVNALRPLVAPNNSIGVYPNSNAIIITDYSSNIKRIAKIISQLTATDDGVATKPVIVQLHSAVAADVAEILNSYMSGGGSTGGAGGSRGGRSGGGANSDTPSATITVNANDNSIIIYSPIQSTTNELVDLAQRIDKDSTNVHSNLHVVYLRNGDAAHIAEILRDVMKNQEDPDIKATSSLANFATEPTSTFSASGSSGSGGSSGGSSTPSAPAASTKPVSSNKGNGNSNNKPDQPDIVIQADPTTNSLIIEAPQAIYKNMRMIIDMLDVRRAQVMIEAMIADITQDQEGAFGIQWLTGAGNNNMGALALGNYGGTGPDGTPGSLSSLATTGIGAVQSASGSGAAAAAAGGLAGGATGSGPSPLAIPNQMLVGLVTGTVSVGGQTIPGLSALANMIENNNAGNILSRPTIITMDNEEARIMVGSNIGIPNGSIQSAAGIGATGATTVTRQDLGIILQIKPLITQSGAIQLEVYQENSSVDPSVPLNSQNGPTFFERKLRTSLLVDDGQIIALGGMTEDKITIEQDGVPGLSDIPYIGWLFSWQYRKHSKENLVLFLHPVIIKNADGAKALTNERYRYIMNVQNTVAAKGNAMLPGINAVNLENQLPYDDRVSPQNKPSLNLNKDIPIVDTTGQGKNFDPNRAAKAIDTSAARLIPLQSPGQ